MGLGQVRDLRRSAAQQVIETRQESPFQSLRDLLSRVALQPKEVTHLIQCGGLDGLSSSRAALLRELSEIDRGGSARQMALPLVLESPVAPEESGQRLAWERQILGLPISIHPLEVVAEQLPDHQPLSTLSPSIAEIVTTIAFRLPGYTGGSGFFISDGQTLLIAKADSGRPQPDVWQPIRLTGHLRQDRYGTTWFHAERLTPI
jgi:hypothetical protein